MTSLLDKRSQPAGKSEVDLFSLPPTQVAIERGYWTEIHLKHTLTDPGPFEFHVPADPSFLDLAKNFLFMELKITKKDGTPVTEPPPGADGQPEYAVGPINLIAKTLFKQVKVYLNNKVCMDSGDGYAFTSYMLTELNNSSDVKNNYLTSAMYEHDTSGKMNDEANKGFQYRASRFKGGNTVQCMAPIHCDIFNQERVLLSHMDVRLELHRNSDAFCLLSFDKTDDYKIKIQKMSWFVKKIDLAPSLALGLERYLTKDTAKYPIRRIVCKSINIDAGMRDTPNVILTSGQIPRRIILTFTDRNGYFGAYAKNPLDFQPFNVREISITAGGIMYPRNPIELNFYNGNYVHGYINFLESLNAMETGKCNGLDMDEYSDGYFFYGVDLTPDSSDNSHWELVQEGTVTVRVIFREDLKQHIKMICFCEYDNLITIDKHRNVFLDYSA